MRAVPDCIDKSDSNDSVPECAHHHSHQEKLSTSRRRQIRYPLRNSVLYRWERDGVQQRGRGWTKDVSEEGIYVSSRNCPQEGDSVNLVFRLSRRSSEAPQLSARLEMQARVLRIDRDHTCGEDIGFAVLRRSESTPAQNQFSSRPPREVRHIVPWHFSRTN
jgi:hypothetical protein